jgi:hypothetical protein
MEALINPNGKEKDFESGFYDFCFSKYGKETWRLLSLDLLCAEQADWNSLEALTISDDKEKSSGAALSLAMKLLYESEQAQRLVNMLVSPDGVDKRKVEKAWCGDTKGGTDAQYDTSEEKRVITKIQNRASKITGVPVRTNHRVGRKKVNSHTER